LEVTKHFHISELDVANGISFFIALLGSHTDGHQLCEKFRDWG
jgi:hypothetical protein